MASLVTVTELQRTLADRNVLSVYIAAEEHDPTERSSWRTRLNGSLDGVAHELDREARDEFAGARRHLEAQLSTYAGFLPGRGWVGFATTDAIHLWTEVPAPMPDLTRWRRGPLLGPWLRAVKQDRAVIVALVDGRRARMLRYQAGALTEDADYRADEFIDDLTDRNMSKRAATRSGVRGETATDAADRIMKREADRLLKLVAEKIRTVASDTLVVIGGPAVAAAALQKMLLLPFAMRLLVLPSLHVTMTPAEVKALLEPAVSALTQRLQRSVVQDVLDRAAGGDRGIMGSVGTMSAGELGQVELLLLTPRFMHDREDVAEELIALVLERGGAIDVVAGEAATLLDTGAAGVAARLRFVRQAPTAGGGVRQD